MSAPARSLSEPNRTGIERVLVSPPTPHDARLDRFRRWSDKDDLVDEATQHVPFSAAERASPAATGREVLTNGL